jgi:hypothetical protein
LAKPQVAIEHVDRGASHRDGALADDAFHRPEIRVVEHHTACQQQPVQHLGGLVVNPTLQSVAQAFLDLEVEHRPRRRFTERLRREFLAHTASELVQFRFRRVVGRIESLDDAALGEEQQASEQIGNLRATVVVFDRSDDELHVDFPLVVR